MMVKWHETPHSTYGLISGSGGPLLQFLFPTCMHCTWCLAWKDIWFMAWSERKILKLICENTKINLLCRLISLVFCLFLGMYSFIPPFWFGTLSGECFWRLWIENLNLIFLSHLYNLNLNLQFRYCPFYSNDGKLIWKLCNIIKWSILQYCRQIIINSR
jgi:hypothetical protein